MRKRREELIKNLAFYFLEIVFNKANIYKIQHRNFHTILQILFISQEASDQRFWEEPDFAVSKTELLQKLPRGNN